MRNELNRLVLGRCNCGIACDNCEQFPPPSLPEEALAWDVLGVDFKNTRYLISRCCSRTLPLTQNWGGYTSGQTVPYYQPDGVGPPLTENGLYSVNIDRRPSLRLGPHPENVDDASTPADQPGSGGSRMLVDSLAAEGFTHAPYPGGTASWIFAEYGVAFLRMTRPEPGEAQHLFLAVGHDVNGEGDSSFDFKIGVADMTTGDDRLYFLTDDAVVEYFSDAGSSPVIAGGQNGQKFSIAHDRLVYVFGYDFGAKTLRVEHRDLRQDLAGGAWISTADRRLTTYDLTDGIQPVAWQYDNAAFFLEMEIVAADQHRIYANGPKGRTLLVEDAPAGIPFNYQRRGNRHVFLYQSGSGAGGFFEGDLLYDIEAAATAADDCGHPASVDLSGGGGGVYCTVGPEGEVYVVTTDGVQRLGDNGWSLTADGTVAVGASVSRETYYGWVHIRGVPYRAAETLLNASSPRDFKGGVTSSDVLYDFAVHPNGPSSGVLITGQRAVNYTEGADPYNGNEAIHWQGEDWDGYTTQQDLDLEGMFYWRAPNVAFDSLSTPKGLPAAPAPAHFGPLSS